MQTMLLYLSPDMARDLKRENLLVLEETTNLFDILAGRGQTYRLNIPKSKYHHLQITERPFSQHFTWDDGEVTGDYRYMNVYILHYDTVKFPKLKESYLKNYLLKLVDK